MAEVGLEELEVKVHYACKGEKRCTSFFVEYHILEALQFDGFYDLIQEEAPYLKRMGLMRFSYKDYQNDYVDLSQRNFNKFLLSAPPLNIRVEEGDSPAPRPVACNAGLTSSKHAKSKRVLFSDDNKPSKSPKLYLEPMEMDISVKENLLAVKKDELAQYAARFEHMQNQYDPKIPRDSRKLCHNCHLREGHAKNKCKHPPCNSIILCGEIDMHPDKKKELAALGDLKNKSEAEVKKLCQELQVKKASFEGSKRTFESRIHSALINSNPEKYLDGGVGGVKQRILSADKQILKKHYSGVVPGNIEFASSTWKTIIDSYIEKFNSRPIKMEYKNPVLEEMKKMFPKDGQDTRPDSGSNTESDSSNNMNIAEPCLRQQISYPTTPQSTQVGWPWYPVYMPIHGYGNPPHGLYPTYQWQGTSASATITSPQVQEEIYPPLPPEPPLDSANPPLPPP